MQIMSCGFDFKKPYTSNTNINFKGKTDSIVNITKKQSKELSLTITDKLLTIFKKDAYEAPSGLTITKTSPSGMVSAFSKRLDNGSLLEVTKRCKTLSDEKLLYAIFKVTSGCNIKEVFGINLKTGELLKSDSMGRLLLVNNAAVKIDTKIPEYEQYVEKLKDYSGQIFNEKSYEQKFVINTERNTVKTSPVRHYVKFPILEKVDEYAETSDEEIEKMIELDRALGSKFKATGSVKLLGSRLDDSFDEFLRQEYANAPVRIIPKEELERDRMLAEKKESKFLKGAVQKAAKSVECKQETESNPVALKSTAIKEKRPWHINKDVFDLVSDKTKKEISEINDIFLRLGNLLDEKRSQSAKIVEWKNQYENTIYNGRSQKNIIFKYKEGETISVWHNRKAPRYTRIIHTDKNGTESHFLIEDNEKIVSNLNKNNPWIMPEKFRYMKSDEIQSSHAEEYICYIRQELEKYYEYMYKNLDGDTRVVKRNGRNTGKKHVELIKPMEITLQERLNKFGESLEKMADSDAKDIVTRYFKALSISFRKYAKEGLENFKLEMENYLKN